MLEKPFLGVYLPDFPGRWQSLEDLESKTGSRFDLVSTFQAWGSRYSSFDRDSVKRLMEEGRVPMITWEPWVLPSDYVDPSKATVQSHFSAKNIASGTFDTYIKEWAFECAALPGTILLRPMHEMNGNWYPWCGAVGDNSTSAYIAAWRHIREIFENCGASKVQWVWSPYAISVPDTEQNEALRYFPGKDAVDLIAVDGYNWGEKQPHLGWQSFRQIFRPICERLANGTDKPIFLAETASNEKGGDKAQWIREAFQELSDGGYAQGLVWFNADKECDWRIESSAAALEAFRDSAAKLKTTGAKI